MVFFGVCPAEPLLLFFRREFEQFERFGEPGTVNWMTERGWSVEVTVWYVRTVFRRMEWIFDCTYNDNREGDGSDDDDDGDDDALDQWWKVDLPVMPMVRP